MEKVFSGECRESGTGPFGESRRMAIFCQKCFFRKEKTVLQKDHGRSVGLINPGNIRYGISGSDQMFSAGVILPGNIASHCGKGSRGKAHSFHIYGGPDTVLFFPQKDISDGNVPENRKCRSGYLPEKYRKIPQHSLSFTIMEVKFMSVSQEAPAVPVPDRDLQFRCYRKVEESAVCASRVADFLRMEGFATVGAELLFVKRLRLQNCLLYFLGMQRLFDVIDGF